MSAHRFFVIGVTHRTAPFGVRERLSLSAEAEAGLAEDLSAADLGEFVVLNTCNRVEIFGIGGPGAELRIEQAICEWRSFDPAEFRRFRLFLEGREAVRHLLEIAAGLDSQLLGENEIFGQVKKAYAAAQARGSTGPILNRLFQKAFQAAKQARSETAIAQGQVSAASVAVGLALDIFGRLADARILLLGAGEMGEKSARAFRSRGASDLVVASRRLERAAELASALGAQAVPFGQWEGRLAEFDVVVCATGAPGAILSRAAVAEAMRRRPQRPLLLLDLAMPRNVEPAAAEAENVFVYNLDDLAGMAAANRAARAEQADTCRRLLAGRAEALWRQVKERFARPCEETVRPAAWLDCGLSLAG